MSLNIIYTYIILESIGYMLFFALFGWKFLFVIGLISTILGFYALGDQISLSGKGFEFKNKAFLSTMPGLDKLFAAFFLLIPGVFTDLLGFYLWIRRFWAPYKNKRRKKKSSFFTEKTKKKSKDQQDTRIIDADYEVIQKTDDEQD